MIDTSQLVGFVPKDRNPIMNLNFKEIERKYLLSSEIFRHLPSVKPDKIHSIKQTYLIANKGEEVRLRSVNGTDFYMVVKYGEGLVRTEYDFLLASPDSARMVLDKAEKLITKTRLTYGRWEIDGFEGALMGLVVAEIELVNEHETVEIPEFISKYLIKEVTEDSQYKNKNLINLKSLAELK